MDKSAHVPTFDTCSLTRLGSQALVRTNKTAGAHCPFVTRQRVERGAGWVEGTMDRIPRVTAVSEQEDRQWHSVIALVKRSRLVPLEY